MPSDSHRFVAALALTFLAGSAVGYLTGHRAPPVVPVAAGRALDARVSTTAAQDWAQAHRASERGDARRSAEALAVDADLVRPILAAVRARDYFQRRHDIYEFGQKLDRDTIRAAMEAVQQLSEADREPAQYPLVARWLELDPAAAYEWVGALPKAGQRSELMLEFFHSLGMKDPVAALGFLRQHEAVPNRGEDFTYNVFEAWSVHDPAAAVDAALNLTKKESRGSGLGIALGRWAKRDPLAALARVGQFQDAEMRRENLRIVLREWAEEDPHAAASHAMSLPAGRDRNEALASAISGAATADGDVALRLIEQMPAGAMRTEALTRVIGELDYKEPKVAAEFVLALPPNQQRNSMYQVVSGLSRQDRAAALEWAGRLSSAEARGAALQRIVQDWSSDDPKAAAEYCVSTGMAKPDILGNAVANWARNDSRAALAWAGALPEGAEREAALTSGISALGGSDPRQAANLATSMLKGEKQAQALGSIAGSWAAKDPVAAAAWAEQLSDPAARMHAAQNIASAWARQDPAAAAAWAMQSPGRGHALSTITGEWAGQDPAGAAKWLDRLSSGDTRDSAVMSFSQAIADADPEGAAAWAATIVEPSQRANTLSEVFQQWKRADPKSADAWLRATPALSEEARARMLRSGY